MDTNITNIANVAGTYNSLPTTLTSEAVVTPMTDGLTVTKIANKQMWADNNLTYTITIANTSALPFESITFTDIIDPTLATLVEDSVTIDGSTVAYTFDDVTGTLTVTVPDIEAADSAVIGFQIAKI